MIQEKQNGKVLIVNGWMLTGLFAAAFLVTLAFGISAEQSTATLAAFVFLLLAGATAAKRRIRLVSPFTLIVVGIALTCGARPAYLAFADRPMTYAPSVNPDGLPAAAGIALISTALILLGYFSPLGKAAGRRIPAIFSPIWSSRRTYQAAIAVAAVGAVSLAAMFYTQGFGISSIWNDSVRLRSATSSEGAYYITYLSSWCCWAVFYLLFIRALASRFTLRRVAILSAVFGLCAAVSMVYGTRSALLAPILGALWLWDLDRSRLRLQRLLPLMAFAIIWVTAGGMWRQADALAVPVENRIELAREMPLSDLAQGVFGRFDFFDFWAYALDNFGAKEPDFYWGRSYTDFLVQPVPRAFWRDKPYKTSARLVRSLILKNADLETVTTTPEWGLITESYVNFGVIGIALGSLILGMLVRAHETYTESNRLNPSVLFLNVQVFMATLAWLLAGFATEMTQMLLMNFVLSSIVLLFVTRQRVNASSRIGVVT